MRTGYAPVFLHFSVSDPVHFQNSNREKLMVASRQNGHRSAGMRALMAALALLAVGVLFASAPGSARAAPAAGTVIGNQAMATYTDQGGRPPQRHLQPRPDDDHAGAQLHRDGLGRALRHARADGLLPARHHQHGQRHGHLCAQSPDHGRHLRAHGPRPPVLRRRQRGRHPGQRHPDNDTRVRSWRVPPSVSSWPARCPGAPSWASLARSRSRSPTRRRPPNTSNYDTTTVSDCALTVTKSMSVIAGGSPNTNGGAHITVTLSLPQRRHAAACSTRLEIRTRWPPASPMSAGSGRWSVSVRGHAALHRHAGGRPGRHRLRFPRQYRHGADDGGDRGGGGGRSPETSRSLVDVNAGPCPPRRR